MTKEQQLKMQKQIAQEMLTIVKKGPCHKTKESLEVLEAMMSSLNRAAFYLLKSE